MDHGGFEWVEVSFLGLSVSPSFVLARIRLHTTHSLDHDFCLLSTYRYITSMSVMIIVP